jgi:PqqD family protein of HPr-rel-A system
VPVGWKKLPGEDERGTAMQLARYVKFREEKFGGVLFETRSEKVFTLNPTATAVVREIQAGAAEDVIIDRLQDRFDDRSGAIAREVAALIAELRERGLVEG